MILFENSLFIRLCLSVIYFTNIFQACSANHILTEINAINFENIIHKVNFDSIEIRSGNDSSRNLADEYNDSKCVKQFSDLRSSYNRSELWAMKVLDAWGKTPSGILSGNTISMGDFDQCIAVKHEIMPNNEFIGQYCGVRVLVNISEIIRGELKANVENMNEVGDSLQGSVLHRAASGPPQTMRLSYAICGPATCSPKMLTEIITASLKESNINYVSNVMIAPQSCQKQTKPKLKTEDILAVSFFGLIAFLMCTSTIYDIVKTLQDQSKQQTLIAFSIYTNTAKIFAQTQTKSLNEITCLHGLRSLSMCSVLASHAYDFIWRMPMANPNNMSIWLSNYYSMLILSTNKAVDTFFFMSGMLLAWSMLKQLQKNDGKFNYIHLYLHRYLRLTPLLAVCILFVVTIYKYLGSGPIWAAVVPGLLEGPCRNNWWSSLLYIQNYYDPHGICLPQTWYLSADMQLYILSPPFIYLLYRYKNKIIPILVALCIGSSGIVLYKFIKYDFTIKYADDIFGPEDDRRPTTYHATHARCASWIVGILFGYALFHINGKRVHIRNIILYPGWIVSLLAISGSIFANYPLQQANYEPQSGLLNGLYTVLPRVVWPMALCFIVFACHFGHGGPVNWFLSLSQWQPFSRLTYAMYLTHFQIILFFVAHNRSPPYFSDLKAFHGICGYLFLSFFVALIFSLAFEYPMFVLEKLLFKRKQSATVIAKPTTAEN